MFINIPICKYYKINIKMPIFILMLYYLQVLLLLINIS